MSSSRLDDLHEWLKTSDGNDILGYKTVDDKLSPTISEFSKFLKIGMNTTLSEKLSLIYCRTPYIMHRKYFNINDQFYDAFIIILSI